MGNQFKDILIPLSVTLLILLVLEIVITAIFPIFGLQNYTLPFSTLIVLYIGLKLETPYLAILIFFVQYLHSLFSIEGWEIGVIAGVSICILISYLRDLLHFSSAFMTMFLVQAFHLVWFVVTSSLIYMRIHDSAFIWDRFFIFLPESIVISLLSPLLFSFLDKIWNVRNDSSHLGASY